MAQATLDGDLETGWSIDPAEGKPHVAVFEAEQAVGFPAGTTLRFVLQQGSAPGHNLGRLRLSVTTAMPPLPEPMPSEPPLLVKGQVPETAVGGLLVVSLQMSSGSHPAHLRGPGQVLTARGTLAGRAADFTPVVGTDTYPSCWQAWRLPVPASDRPQPFELEIINRRSDVEVSPRANFIPGSPALSDR